MQISSINNNTYTQGYSYGNYNKQNAVNNNSENIMQGAANYYNNKTNNNDQLSSLLDDNLNSDVCDFSNSKNKESQTDTQDKTSQPVQDSTATSSSNPFDENKNETKTSWFNLLNSYKPGEFLKSTIQNEQSYNNNNSFLNLTLANS